jgi:hypothetical protein
MLSFVQASYILNSKKNLNPLNVAVAFEAGKKYQKTSIELTKKISYDGLKNGLESRLFAGTMLRDAASDPFYSFAPSGRSGPEQFLF